jgi:hypothetical protein
MAKKFYVKSYSKWDGELNHYSEHDNIELANKKADELRKDFYNRVYVSKEGIE